MVLSGKCKEAFGDQCEYDYQDFMKLSETLQNALIIDFFDSVGIYVEIKNKFGQRKQCQRFSFIVKNYNSGFLFNSRTEATNAAIEKAVEIFNNR